MNCHLHPTTMNTINLHHLHQNTIFIAPTQTNRTLPIPSSIKQIDTATDSIIIKVQTLLQQMQSRFQTMSESMVSKIDEMGSRMDELEQSINDLIAEMGVPLETSPSKPPKDNPPPPPLPKAVVDADDDDDDGSA